MHTSSSDCSWRWTIWTKIVVNCTLNVGLQIIVIYVTIAIVSPVIASTVELLETPHFVIITHTRDLVCTFVDYYDNRALR